MARFSFGGAQDLSGIFADMYRIGDAQAARERAAEDDNVINQWETGELSDEEFYAYAESRIDGASDPEERSQWEQILRDARQGNEGEVIEDTAEEIMDGIEAGTRSWDDLLAYYTAERRKLRPSDPLYRELSAQIDQVEDRKRDNEVASTYGSIEYRFRSGQISGAQAGAEMRALAERYKANDPQKYYELLGQALDLERPIETGGGGSGGGGSRSSGSGGANDSLEDTINDLEGFESRLLALSKQALEGQRVGSVTLPGADGVPVTETFTLLNKDGSVTGDLRAIHEQTLMLYDELEQAQLSLGTGAGRDAAGETAERRSAYITDYVQPANTISKERQWARLTSDFVGAVQRADSASSPAMAWRDIQRQAERLARWGSRLNTRTTSTDVQKRATDEEVRENPELGAAVRRQTTSEETDVARRILPEFESDVLAQIGVIMAAVNSDDPAAIIAAFENLPEDSPLAAAAPAMAQIRTIQRGLADGSWSYAMHPELGVIPVEMIREQTGIGPDGNPTFNTIPLLYGNDGNLIYDPARADLTEVIAKVGKEYQPVLAVTQQQTVAMGDFVWDGVQYRRGQAIPQDVLDAIEKAPEGTAPPPIGNMRATQLPGGETFYGIDMPDGSVGWYRNRVPRSLKVPPLPAPYAGPAENAQAAFTRLGLDTTGRMVLDNAVATGNRVGIRAFDKFAGPQANIQRATGDVGYSQPAVPRVIDPGVKLGTGTYRSRQPAVGASGAEYPGIRQQRPTLTMAQTLSAVRGDTGPMDSIKQIGVSLGIRGRGFDPKDRTPVVRPNIAPVARPNVSVRRPNVDVAGLRAMRDRLLASRNTIRSGIMARRTINPGITNDLNRVRQRSGGYI